MRALRGVAAAALMLGPTACGPPHPVDAPKPPADPAFEALYADVAQRARAGGAGPFEMIAHGYGAEGERIGGFVDVSPDACVLVAVAASSGVSDVDAFAYADDGSTVAADERPNAQAAFMVCPPHPGRIYVSARVVTGAGAIAIATSTVHVEQAEAVSRAADARTATAESGRLDSWPRLEERVRSRRKLLGARWDELRRIALQVDPRAPTRTTFEVLANRCVDVFVAPSDEVGAIDLVAEDGEGRIIARGEPEAQSARTLVLCTRTGEEVSLSIRPRESAGLVALVVGQSSDGGEQELARGVHVDHLTASEPLASARKVLADALSKAGFAEGKLAGTSELRVGSRTTFPLSLPAGCARVDAIAGAPLGGFRVAAWELDGQAISEIPGGSRATVWACGAARAAELDAEADARPGPLAVEVRAVKDAPKALVEHPLAASRLLGAMYGDALAAPEGWELTQVVALAAAERVRQPLSIAAHTCAEVGAAIGAGGSGLELRLADDLNHVDAITRGRFVVIDRACAADAAVSRTVELRLTTGEGEGLLLVRQVTH
ncbi:MAG: hypothetical protein U0414_28895 [Polyangiaceae bacterium]